jgi:hypothetical protein
MSKALREAAQQALEALEYHVEQTRPIHRTSEAITALRAVLARQTEPVEPVAKVELMMTGGNAGLSTRIVEKGFNHSIGADRFKVVRGAFWWHVLIGDSTREHGKFRSQSAAQQMADDLLREFRNGAFVQHEASEQGAEIRDVLVQALDALDCIYSPLHVREINKVGAAMAALRAALAESERDWSLLEATQESLREHMAEIQRLRAALAQPATIAEWWAAKQAASGEPVAWMYTGIKQDGSEHGPHLVWRPAYMDAMSASKGVKATPLYTAQPAPAASGEPVAWQAVGGSIWAHKTREDDRPLYAAPQPAPARGPLPEAQINEFAAEAETPAWGEWYSDEDALMKFARAIEAAHGIGAPAKEAP